MKQIILAAVLAISLGIASSFPVFTCDKLKDVVEGFNNDDQYLVKLKDSNNYMDAKYLVDLVKQYQTNLELYASNVHGPSVKSGLEMSENAGVLQGTLSQQAIILVCLEGSVESIIPDYSTPVVLPEGSGDSETVNTINCPKLILDESYSSGNKYSITFQPRTTTINLYNVITDMEMAQQNDDTLSFKYYYSIRRGKQFSMVAEMNTRALEMICKEVKVKEIKVKHDGINKRDVTTEQEVATSGPCDLPPHKDEFPRFIFQYKEGADLEAIRKTVEEYTDNSAQVQSAIVLSSLDYIIFQMNRAAYLQACTNSEVTLVEYEQFIPGPGPVGHCGLPEHTEEFPKYIFVYNRGVDLDAIVKSVEGYTDNSAEVMSAIPLHSLDMIIFQMNRAAYLNACSNTEIQSVEYDQETTIAQGQITTEQPQQPTYTRIPNICEQVDSLPDSRNAYVAVLKRPGSIEGKQSRCLRLITKLQNQAATSENGFWALASKQSCATNGNEVTMTVRLSVEALRYTCGLRGLDISLIRRTCSGLCFA